MGFAAVLIGCFDACVFDRCVAVSQLAIDDCRVVGYADVGFLVDQISA